MSEDCSPITRSQRLLRQMPWIAGLLFLLWCVAFSWHGPGLQYDEALSVRGAVDLTAPAARSITCAGGIDIKLNRRCWPLMIAPYVGAVKDYVAAPFFRVFGIHVFVARMAAALFGAVGIAGFALFLRDQVSVMAGAAFAMFMAFQPAYLDQVLFDNGNIAVSMGFIGIVAWTGNRFLRLQTPVSVVALGAACGAAVWGRLNFIWIVGAVLVGIIVGFPWKRLVRLKVWLLWSAGAFAAALPMLAYHWRNRSALKTFVSANADYRNFPEFLQKFVYRMQMISEILFSDREHRGIWEGDTIFSHGTLYYWGIALLAGLWCILRRPPSSDAARWGRCMGVALVVLLSICFTTQLPIAQHHLVVLIPFIAVCVVVSLIDIARLGRSGAMVVSAVGVAYLGAALVFNTGAANAIHKTRGVDMWSDAVDSVDEFLQGDRAAGPLNVLDWGLEANLFFLSKAGIAAPELFWGADRDKSGRGLTWAEEVSKGGRFLTTASQDRGFPTATAGFEKALQESKKPFSVQAFNQQNGRPYALVYTIEPKK